MKTTLKHQDLSDDLISLEGVRKKPALACKAPLTNNYALSMMPSRAMALLIP